MLLGLPLAVLIGLISGLALILLLLAATAEHPGLKETAAVITQLFAIPTFWFGGPWVTTDLLRVMDRAEILPWYLPALAGIFVLIAIYPMLLLLIRLGNQIGR